MRASTLIKCVIRFVVRCRREGFARRDNNALFARNLRETIPSPVAARNCATSVIRVTIHVMETDSSPGRRKQKPGRHVTRNREIGARPQVRMGKISFCGRTRSKIFEFESKSKVSRFETSAKTVRITSTTRRIASDEVLGGTPIAVHRPAFRFEFYEKLGGSIINRNVF